MEDDKAVGIDFATAEQLEVGGEKLSDMAVRDWLDIDCKKCGHGCYWQPEDVQNYECTNCGDKTNFIINNFLM